MQINRRSFLQTGGAAAAALGFTTLSCEQLQAAAAAKGAPHAEKLGWRLGCQAYSFNRFTFFEAVDKNASLGLRVIEAYPGQKLSAKTKDVKFSHDSPAEIRAAAKAKLAEAKVKMVNYGVVGLSKDEAASRKVFEFAKEMGVQTIVSEPQEDAFEVLDRLANEYGINVALHNHPKPSRYWNPNKVLEVCKGRSKRIGACADTGHWMRSGINPLEALKQLEGHIISFHFKDLNGMGGGDKKPATPLHDVPWGTGKADVPALLAEIKRQRIRAVFSIEYEYNWENSLPEIAECVAFFEKVATELSS